MVVWKDDKKEEANGKWEKKGWSKVRGRVRGTEGRRGDAKIRCVCMCMSSCEKVACSNNSDDSSNSNLTGTRRR